MNSLKSYARLTKRERQLFREALFYLFASKLLLLMLPFRICINFINDKEEEKMQASSSELCRIRDAVRRANKLAFWKNICLVKSFAARFMLQKRKIRSEMFYGLMIKDKKLEAHAWLIAGDVEITPKGNKEIKAIYKV